MTPDYVATSCFTLAILHTFATGGIRAAAHHHPVGSVRHRLLHPLGEVEVTFALWAGVYLLGLAGLRGRDAALVYAAGLDLTEPGFVFVTMTVCSSRPILNIANQLIERAARLLPLRPPVALYAATLTLGPLMGSLVTEPAAMTVTALILLDRVFTPAATARLKYQTLGTLFVNVSIGGTLTPFAAPPVLMVARGWGWDLRFVLINFGWRAALAVISTTTAAVVLNRRELGQFVSPPTRAGATRRARAPGWIAISHLAVLGGVIASAHHPIAYVSLFLIYLGLARMSRAHQDRLNLRAGALVGIFLVGLIILGPGQRWWLSPLVGAFGPLALYFGAIGLTAITDNAALTYLGSTLPNLGEAARYALVAGAVVGGGLTVIANAPNPAGHAILGPAFGPAGIRPLPMLRAALLPTAIAAAWFAIT